MPALIYTDPYTRPFTPTPTQPAVNPFGMSQGGKPFNGPFGGVPSGRSPTGAATIDPASGARVIDNGSYGNVPNMPAPYVPQLTANAGLAGGGPIPWSRRAPTPYSVPGSRPRTNAAGGTLMGGAFNSNGSVNRTSAPVGNTNLSASPINAGSATIGGGYGGAPTYAQQLLRDRNAAANQQTQTSLAILHQQAADQIRQNPLAGQSPINPIRLTENEARTVYHNMQQNYPGQNVNQMFVDHMGKEWNQDGAALIQKWQAEGNLGQPVSEYHPPTAATPGIPLNMLGAPNSAGNSIAARIPGMSASQAGQTVGGTPASPGYFGPGAMPAPVGTIAPMLPGYASTNPPAAPVAFNSTPAPVTSINGWGAMAPGRAQAVADASSIPPGWTPDQAALVSHERLMQADNLDADSQARFATLPVTAQQQFNANNQNAQAFANALNQPRVNYNIRAGGFSPTNTPNARPGPATRPSNTPTTRPADRVAAFKATANLRVIDPQTGKMRPLTNDERQQEANRILGGPQPTTQPTSNPVPRSVAQQYLTQYGNVDRARAALQADGYNPNQYAD